MKNDMLIDNRSHEVWIERLRSLRTKRSWFERTKVLIKKKDIKAIVKNRLGEKVRKIEYIKRSKSGNDSFRVVLKNRSLKCYESWTSRHAQRVAVISNTLINNDIPFPKVFFTQNRYVVAEWIEGTCLDKMISMFDKNLLRMLVEYQSRIHNCPYPKEIALDSDDYSYIDFLLVRLLLMSNDYVPKGVLIKIIEIFNKEKLKLNLRITHPDFTLRNIVFWNGTFVLIDNETLNVDKGYEYDILNTYKMGLSYLNSEFRENYIKLYSNYGSLGTLKNHNNFWNIIWQIRMAGKFFQEGNSKMGLRSVDNLQISISKLNCGEM